jgi:uncharacterized protein YjbI with pentapeptide repeats
MQKVNKTIQKMLQEEKISQEEYDILFEPKNNWFTLDISENQDWNSSADNIKKFEQSLCKVISLQTGEIKLNNIHFPPFYFLGFTKEYKVNINEQISFDNSTFWSKADFGGTKFSENVYFMKVKFEGLTIFIGTTFEKEANFTESSFFKDVQFDNARFRGNIVFMYTKFKQEANFSYTIFENDVDFDKAEFEKMWIAWEMQFYRINLQGASFKEANLLGLTGFEKDAEYVTLEKKHFFNKESARLIKAHFEQQNNITEANKYFRLEQDLYLDMLKNKDSQEPNRWQTITALYFTRIVSAFGTNWIIALLSLFIFGYLATIGYILSTEINVSHLVYSSLMAMGLMAIYFSVYTKKDSETYKLILISFAGFFFCMAFYFGWGNALEATNLVIKLINPTNSFKDDETFKNLELYGVIVRLITATILYQLLVAFRQNTRRT